jgi:arylsulfatase A-like enzyme
MLAPARAVMRIGGALLAVTALAAACRKAETPSPVPEYLLAPSFKDAEVRSDGFDIDFLLATGAFRWPSWQDAAGEGDERVLWSLTESPTLRLPLATRAPKLLTLRARCHRSLGPKLPLAILLGDVLLAEVELGTEDKEFQVAIGAEAQARGGSTLVLKVSRRYVPPPKDRDGRPAAIGVSGLAVSRGASAAARALPSREGESLLLPPGSSVGYYLRLGPAARLTLHARAQGPGRLEGALATDAGAALELGATAIAASRATRVEWPLPRPAGSYARLDLRNPGETPLLLDAAGVFGLDGVGTRPLEPAALPANTSVIVFLTDTLRADRLSTYGFGKPTSPRLDAFAKEAVVFEDAWAQSSWTRPTVASIFTGTNPATHGAVGFERPLAERFTTLAEAAKSAGYKTAALVSNHVVHQRFGFAQGFDEWNDGEPKLYGLSAADVVKRGLAFLDRTPGPFLLYLHTMEPHAVYEPSDDGFRLFAPPGEGRRPSRPMLMRPKLGARAVAYLDGLYQGEIWDNDRAFGALIDGLKERGRLDSTLVVFTADHGEEFYDHGNKGHGQSLYRELTRVPLLARLPGGRRGGAREAAPVAQVDVLPTLCGLLGIAPLRTEGRDLSALWLRGTRPEGVPVLVSETRFGKSEKQALRVGDLKLILNQDPRRYGSHGGPPELYDVMRDPGEKDDLAERRPIAAGWLERRLVFLLENWRRAGARGGAPEKIEMTDEDREALRALGYAN